MKEGRKMTNIDKYLKEGVSVEELARKIDQYCYDNETPDEDTGLSTEELVAMFFEEEIKPTLTEDERVILRNLNKEEFTHIGRHYLGDLFLKYKAGTILNEYNFEAYTHLFQFIQEGEEYSIEELLKGE